MRARSKHEAKPCAADQDGVWVQAARACVSYTQIGSQKQMWVCGEGWAVIDMHMHNLPPDASLDRCARLGSFFHMNARAREKRII